MQTCCSANYELPCFHMSCHMGCLTLSADGGNPAHQGKTKCHKSTLCPCSNASNLHKLALAPSSGSSICASTTTTEIKLKKQRAWRWLSQCDEPRHQAETLQLEWLQTHFVLIPSSISFCANSSEHFNFPDGHVLSFVYIVPVVCYVDLFLGLWKLRQ